MIGTGAAHYSARGYNQWVALQRSKNISIDKLTCRTVNVQFGIGSTTSIGSVKIDTPIGKVQFHIVEANTPFLLCLRDLAKNGAYYNNLINKVYCSGKSFPVIRQYGHAFLTWGESFINYITQTVYLSETDLHQLHRIFEHPSVRRFVNLMTHSDHKVDPKLIQN